MEVAPVGFRASARRRRHRIRRWRSLPPRFLEPLYAVYTRRLRREVAAAPVPCHVALILDGNRRWASLSGRRDAVAGYRRGADKLDELLRWCASLDIPELTVWALSTENLARRSSELEALIAVLTEKLDALAHASSGWPAVRVRVLGRTETLPAALAVAARAAEERTAANHELYLNIALGYSGRGELVDAARALVQSLLAEGVPPEAMPERIDAAAIARHLYTADHPDPDLIIRTSGEMRLSGFLPWQSSHSEFYFTDVYWPAFRELDFLRAIRTYQARERRYGR